MKRILIILAVLCVAVGMQAFTLDDIKNWSGSGDNRSAIVFQWNVNGETNAIAFGYKWNGSATGWDMIAAVRDNNPRLKVIASTSSYGAYVTGFAWDGNNDGDWDDAEDFTQSGWSTSGYWGYFLKDSFDSTAWTYSNVGCSSRKLANGSVDVWNFGTGTVTWKDIVSAPSNTLTGVDNNVAEKSVENVKYYNIQGIESAQPYTGLNIVVTTYTDGSHKTVKRILK
jgi:hypothetical protein